MDVTTRLGEAGLAGEDTELTDIAPVVVYTGHLGGRLKDVAERTDASQLLPLTLGT